MHFLTGIALQLLTNTSLISPTRDTGLLCYDEETQKKTSVSRWLAHSVRVCCRTFGYKKRLENEQRAAALTSYHAHMNVGHTYLHYAYFMIVLIIFRGESTTVTWKRFFSSFIFVSNRTPKIKLNYQFQEKRQTKKKSCLCMWLSIWKRHANEHTQMHTHTHT